MTLVSSVTLPAGSRRARRAIPSSRPLFTGAPGLSVQADASVDNAAMVAQVSASEGIGAIHTVKMKLPGRKARIKDLVAVHRNNGAEISTLGFDAACYAGKNRDIGAKRLDPDWITAQLNAGVEVAYTDSPYIPDSDVVGLESVLVQTREMRRPVVAVLPVGLEWLKRDAAVLTHHINKYRVPIALVLEHPNDPLGVTTAVTGLIHVMTHADVPVVLLRSDLSVLGALCLGASMGAIGTRSGLRHLYPIPRQDSRGPGTDEHISALVPRGLCYRRLDTINTAIAKAPDEQDWFTCPCTYCVGMSLSAITTPEHAYLHTMASAAALAEELLAGGRDPQSWAAKCDHAQSINLDLNSRLDGGWKPPKFQAAWRANLLTAS